jgi:serine/threonine protein kinase
MDFRARYQYNPKTDLIAKGGFAKVYKGYDTIRECIVALKFFKSDVSEKYNLLSEIKRVINFEHPNICRYYDVAVLQGENHLGEEERTEVGIMEYMESGDIRTYIKKFPQYRDKLLKDVLHGLAYLHANHLIHRDLKPNNILIKSTPIGPVAKITDFGISKAVNSASTTKSSELLGTIEFMAPEQFNVNKYGINRKLSTNVDLWSWGCLAYEILKNDSLFGSRDKGEPTEQILGNILQEPYDQKLNALPEPYQQAVRLCLVKEASLRAQRPDDIIAILERNEDSRTQDTKIIDIVGGKVNRPNQPSQPIIQLPLDPAVTQPPQPPTKNKNWILVFAGVIGIGLSVYSMRDQLGHNSEIISTVDSTTVPSQDTLISGNYDSLINPNEDLSGSILDSMPISDQGVEDEELAVEKVKSYENEYVTESFENGDKYVGQVKDGHKHGQGTYIWADGTEYVGQWKNDLFHGQGTRTYADGGKYVGQWKDDLRNGPGTFTWANGDEYVGQWKDVAHGQGTLTWAIGDKYTGQFLDDKRNGYGELSAGPGRHINNCNDCVTYKGNFKDNYMDGYGECFDAQGRLLYQGNFSDDKPIDVYPNR